MIDLSNNNGPVDFKRIYKAGQRRVYLKVTESTGFTDKTYPRLRAAAHKAGFKVGGYHFAHATHTPAEEAQHFLAHLGRLAAGKDLRPCLDLEYGSPSAAVGHWAIEWLNIVQKAVGVRPLIYSYGSFVESCAFPRASAGLWLASYGRDDGREHPFSVPRPWRSIVAHQFSSRARVVGCSGLVDISKVFNYQALELAKRK